jgi:hypothetical protein
MRGTFLVSALFAAALLKGVTTDAAGQLNGEHPPALARFLNAVEQGPESYRALRRLEARNRRLSNPAWMDVWTEADAAGFRYEIVGQGGSGYVRDRLFLPALETEQRTWAAADDKGALTLDNYTFEDRGAESSGLAWIGVTPRRNDVMLVKGSIFLRPEDGDLVRVEGALSRTPSFWTRNVEIVRTYERIGGVRVPVRLESTASVRIAGTSTFTMTYEYESINGKSIE